MAPHGHQEIELKRLLVGEGAADKLAAALGPVAAHKAQINHLFDTADRRLRQHRYSMRLRFENGTPILTSKGPSRQVGADTRARTEAEATIDARLAQSILEGKTDPVAVLRELATDAAFAELYRGLDDARAGRPLQSLGHFENQRRTIPVVLPDGLALDVEVDRTRFPDGRIDEEVEIEVPSDDVVAAVEAWLSQRAAAAGVMTRPSTPKIARFFAALGEK
jgi:uncharacterized protein YjbK